MLLPVLFSIGLLLPPQGAAATTGAIQGVVLETGSRAPIAEARVSVTGAGISAAATTDVNGGVHGGVASARALSRDRREAEVRVRGRDGAGRERQRRPHC